MFEKILIEQNPHWLNQPYDSIIPREQFANILKKMKAKELLILYGIRRSGKSTLMKLIINEIMKTQNAQNILYVNLDDPYFIEMHSDPKKLYLLIEEAEKITSHKIHYLLLDEIQNIENWERFIKSTYDSEKFKKIIVTGSNSRLLQGDYAKLLTGRYIKEKIYPLNFREILAFNEINSTMDLINQKSKVLNIIDDMMIYGGFPEVFKQSDIELKREILINYYESIIFKDCIGENNIRDAKKFQDLSHYLITNHAALYSYNGLANIFNCSDTTIKQYIGLLEDCYLMNEIRPYSYSLKKQIKTEKKIYLADNGIFYAAGFQFKENHGKNFENLVFCELQKLGYDPIYYYLEEKECDFIIQLPKRKIAVQAYFHVNERTIERETKGLMKAMREFDLQNVYIITYNQEIISQDNINIIPFWKFFSKNQYE